MNNRDTILDGASANQRAAPNTNAQRLRDFYNTAMDSAKAEQLGISPLLADLDRIEKVNSFEDLIALKSEFEFIGVTYAVGACVDSLFDFDIIGGT